MNDDGKRSQDGGWLFWIVIGMYTLSSVLGLAFSKSLSLGDYPGGDIPWHSIRRDYIYGIVMGVGGLSCVLVGLAFWRLYKSNAGILIAQSVLFFGYPTWQACVIALRCDHVLSPTLARTAWSSFEAYDEDPLFWRGWTVLFTAAMLVTATWLIHVVLERRRARRVAQGA